MSGADLIPAHASGFTFPAVIAASGEKASHRFLEFFTPMSGAKTRGRLTRGHVLLPGLVSAETRRETSVQTLMPILADQ